MANLRLKRTKSEEDLLLEMAAVVRNATQPLLSSSLAHCARSSLCFALFAPASFTNYPPFPKQVAENLIQGNVELEARNELIRQQIRYWARLESRPSCRLPAFFCLACCANNFYSLDCVTAGKPRSGTASLWRWCSNGTAARQYTLGQCTTGIYRRPSSCPLFRSSPRSSKRQHKHNRERRHTRFVRSRNTTYRCSEQRGRTRERERERKKRERERG